jgi:hypothetical protein
VELKSIKAFLEQEEIAPGQALLACLLEQVTGMKTWQHPNFFLGRFDLTILRCRPFALARQALGKLASDKE